jgi:hypothetical protein
VCSRSGIAATTKGRFRLGFDRFRSANRLVARSPNAKFFALAFHELRRSPRSSVGRGERRRRIAVADECSDPVAIRDDIAQLARSTSPPGTGLSCWLLFWLLMLLPLFCACKKKKRKRKPTTTLQYHVRPDKRDPPTYNHINAPPWHAITSRRPARQCKHRAPSAARAAPQTWPMLREPPREARDISVGGARFRRAQRGGYLRGGRICGAESELERGREGGREGGR